VSDLLDAAGHPIIAKTHPDMFREITLVIPKGLADFLTTVYERAKESRLVDPKPQAFQDFVGAMARNAAKMLWDVMVRDEEKIVVPTVGASPEDALAQATRRWKETRG
jgi:hypothetical protein